MALTNSEACAQDVALPQKSVQDLAQALHAVLGWLRSSEGAVAIGRGTCWPQVLLGYRSALRRLLQLHPHSLVGLPDHEIQNFAAGTRDPAACQQNRAGNDGGADAAATLIMEESASLAFTVRAPVLELDEAAALQVAVLLSQLHMCSSANMSATWLSTALCPEVN